MPPPEAQASPSYGSVSTTPSDGGASSPSSKGGALSTKGGALSTAGRVGSTVDHVIEQLAERSTRFQYLAAAIIGLANASDAVEVLCLSFILDKLDDVGDTSKGLLSAAVFMGMLIGGLASGFCSDRFGRRPMLIASLCVNASFCAAAGILPQWEWLAVCRVLSGVGVGGSIPTLFTLFAEYLPRGERGFFISLVAWWWMIGSLYAAGIGWLMIGYLKMSWRVYTVACAVPAGVAAMLIACILPESPRYLFSRGSIVACIRSLQVMAAWAGASPDDVDVAGYVLDGAGSSGRRQSDGAANGGSTGKGRDGDGSRNKLVSSGRSLEIRAFVRELCGPYRRPAVLLSSVWFTLSFGCVGGLGQRPRPSARTTASSAHVQAHTHHPLLCRWYGLNVWLPTLFSATGLSLDPFQDAFLVSAANLPGNVVAALLIDRMGRRVLLCGSLLAACACAIGFAFATRSETGVVAAACMLNAVSGEAERGCAPRW